MKKLKGAVKENRFYLENISKVFKMLFMTMINFKRADARPIEFKTFKSPQDYHTILALMEGAVQEIQRGGPEQIWFLEHIPVFTLGSSARESDVLKADSIPSVQTGRGGQVTYHGPGQLVTYLMLDLNQRQKDLKAYVWTLEEILIRTLQSFGIAALRRPGRVGLWVPESSTRDLKIAALGVRVQKWVTSHGLALNICNDLRPYQDIIPCGIRDHGVTSLQDLCKDVEFDQVRQALKNEAERVF